MSQIRRSRFAGERIDVVLTPAEVRLIDDAAPDIDALIYRAGNAVARRALELLGGGYGRRVTVIAGPGNNGADGRVAAAALCARGVVVEVVDPDVAAIGPCDLVIDAAYGTGLSRPYSAPRLPSSALVLAVDVPSGLDALTGVSSGATRADITVTFGAARQGMFFNDGPSLCGEICIADIDVGLGPAGRRLLHMTPSTAAMVLPVRAWDSHKWNHAVRIFAGSQLMAGAASLAAGASLRAGSGMTVVSSLDGSTSDSLGMESIQQRLVGSDGTGLADAALTDISRFAAVIVGPGIGRAPEVQAAAREIVLRSGVPTVVDADALSVFTGDPWAIQRAASLLVLTPHDGEYRALVGSLPGLDRVQSARDLAATCGAVVVLKGPSTVISSPSGVAWIVDAGDQRLATAGSGDVLSGVIAAVLAVARLGDEANSLDGTAQLVAAAACWHARAGTLAGGDGVIATDIIAALPAARANLASQFDQP